MSSTIRYVIIEDDKQICESLCEIISSDSRFKCVGKFYDAASAQQDLLHTNAHVVLVDLKLGSASGIDIIRQFKPLLPETHFMVITIFEENDLIIDSLKAGATGYILKNSRSEEYIQAINDLLAGGSPLSPTVARKLIATFNPQKIETEYNLTTREIQILKLLADGYLYRQVAESLHISIDTVRTHIRHVYEKLQVQSKVQALNKFYKR